MTPKSFRLIRLGRCAAFSALLIFVAGCGGSAQSQQSLPSQSSRSATASLRFVVPHTSRTTSLSKLGSRAPAYVAATTTALRIVVTPQGGVAAPPITVACSATCSATFEAAVGNDTLALSLNDGGGNLLSTITTTVNVAANVLNAFNLTADPVIDHATLALGSATIPAGTAKSLPVTLNAYDHDNNLIVGSGSFVDAHGTPVTLTLGQTSTTGGGSGSVTLSRTAFTDPTQTSAVATYDGKTLVQSSFTLTSSSTLSAPIAAVTLAITPTVTNEFPLPAGGSTHSVIMGPDGNLWIADVGNGAIAKMSPVGSVVEYALPTPGTTPNMLAVGPDNAIWFTENGQNDIGEISPAGIITEYPIPCCGESGITSGSDGAMWVSLAGSVARVTTAGAVTSFAAGGNQIGIAQGADGNYWTTELFTNAIGRLTPGGVYTSFPIPTANTNPTGITLGADGNVWFTESGAGNIGKITPSGGITEFPLPLGGGDSFGIVSASDGNLWYADNNTNSIGRITTLGAATEFALPTANAAPRGITIGPDATIWIAEENTGRIARLVY